MNTKINLILTIAVTILITAMIVFVPKLKSFSGMASIVSAQQVLSQREHLITMSLQEKKELINKIDSELNLLAPEISKIDTELSTLSAQQQKDQNESMSVSGNLSSINSQITQQRNALDNQRQRLQNLTQNRTNTSQRCQKLPVGTQRQNCLIQLKDIINNISGVQIQIKTIQNNITKLQSTLQNIQKQLNLKLTTKNSITDKLSEKEKEKAERNRLVSELKRLRLHVVNSTGKTGEGDDIGIGVGGCTDISAQNHNPSATVDDGSCLYNEGCTDQYAINYDTLAVKNDGSCFYTLNCAELTSTQKNAVVEYVQNKINFLKQAVNNSTRLQNHIISKLIITERDRERQRMIEEANNLIDSYESIMDSFQECSSLQQQIEDEINTPESEEPLKSLFESLTELQYGVW